MPPAKEKGIKEGSTEEGEGLASEPRRRARGEPSVSVTLLPTCCVHTLSTRSGLAPDPYPATGLPETWGVLSQPGAALWGHGEGRGQALRVCTQWLRRRHPATGATRDASWRRGHGEVP